MLYQTVTIQQVHEEIKGFKTISFEAGHGISYKAGQYLTFVHHHRGTEIRRSYSITSSPVLPELLTIGVKRIENGAFSRHLVDHGKPGDSLQTTGAAGFFTLPQDMGAYHRVVFFAAGSGITPIYSLVKTVLHAHPAVGMLLVYSNPSDDRTLFHKELKDLEAAFPGRLQIHFLFSNTPDLRIARLNRDLLLSLVSAHDLNRHTGKLFYVCGPEAYMRMVTYTLQETGVPPASIRRENFNINSRPPAAPLPPDKATRKALLLYDQTEYRVDVAYPDTILQAARKKGILLPYSCEAGRCGNCVARCLEGRVWMSYNEVLTDIDLKEGLVLTCVGHPEGSDVKLLIS